MRGRRVYQNPGESWIAQAVLRGAVTFCLGTWPAQGNLMEREQGNVHLDPSPLLRYSVWALHWPKPRGSTRARESITTIHTGLPSGADSGAEKKMSGSGSCQADVVVKCPLHCHVEYTH